MKKITKLCLALLACFLLGVQGVSAATEKACATFKNASAASNATWDGTTKTFTWSGSWSNAINNIGLPEGDITKYEKLVVDCEIVSGGSYRILFYSTNKGQTSFQIVMEESGKVEIKLSDYVTDEDYLINCSQICLSGGSTASGEVKVNEVYLETYDSEAVVDDTKKHASFANPTNRNTTWDAATRTFGWTASSYNQLMNIGLPSGDVSKYKKLVIDCTINSGEAFRILFYDSQLGDDHTLWVRESGVTEFNLKTSVPEDYILNCGQICLSGNNNIAEGTAVINALYLETYPEGESFDDIMLTSGMFQNWDGVGAAAQSTGAAGGVANYETEINNGGTIYGFNNGNVPSTSYADLTGCSKMIVKGTAGVGVRTLWNRQTDNGADFIQVVKTIGEDGVVTFDFKNDEDFKGLEYLHLNVIKNNGAAGTIDYITFDGDFELVVVDGKNFTPNFKEYNTATYARTFNTAYTYGTICLPFAPDDATCENYTFYKLDQASVNTLVFVEEAAPKANTAYLYSPKDTETTTHAFTGGETTVSKDVLSTTSGDWTFVGSLKEQTIDLTTGGSFYAYKPDANSGANKISKATTSMTVKPYRAYFHYTGAAEQSLATMRIVVRGAGDNGDGTTAIEEVIAPEQIEGTAPVIYDLLGRPVAQPVKGQIYIVDGKKVVY